MAIKEITPRQAHEALADEPDAVYIDVRTEREFVAGHPRGAVNVPVAFPDPERGMVLNPDFVKVVESNFPKEKKLILGCQAGPRSGAAARLLEHAGYEQVYNVIGGFGGMRDPMGNLLAPGWEGLGLPVSRDNGPGVSYESLAARAAKD
ncbi:MAG TPA: rhodanese-like domain-containing protein [candidate division Zixibacteria bacterium]|nr:rhodanese-like domain-containing protein [candidate division Zixibacteria bacterium]